MTIKVILEEETVYINYLTDVKEIKEKLDYSAIEKLLDFVMENDVSDVSIEDNESCSQYVDLMKTIVQKISEKDFKDCYLETNVLNEQSDSGSLKQDSEEEAPF